MHIMIDVLTKQLTVKIVAFVNKRNTFEYFLSLTKLCLFSTNLFLSDNNLHITNLLLYMCISLHK